jgi:hypothetical protein
MAPHLSNLQFFIVIGSLVFVSLLTLAAIIDIRRKRKAPPFLNYFYSTFDQDQWDRDDLRQGSFSGLTEWRAYNRAHTHAFEDRHSTLRNTHWE